MSEDFSGFKFKAPKEIDLPPPEKNAPKNKLDCSLEEIMVRTRKGEDTEEETTKEPKYKNVDAKDVMRKMKKERGEKLHPNDLSNKKKSKVIDIHIPRAAVDELLNSLNISTKGYRVKLEAVLEPQ